MEGIKIVAFLIFCLLLRVGLSAPTIPMDGDRVQQLEERVAELSEKLKALKEESFHHTKRQASNAILNENRKLIFTSYIRSHI